ncbi:MAG: chorismate synthase [Desulfovibrio sp.]|jgi:chorismate synthase
MSGNVFGELFRLSTYGESHGPGLGGVIDGCPAGLPLDETMIQAELDRRKPGQGPASTARRESDRVRLLSGVFQGVTTGTPIGFHIANEDQRSGDYSEISRVFRPGHADFGFHAKFGLRDYRGGGRSSGRETVARVVGGAVARRLLEMQGVTVQARTVELGGIPAAQGEEDGWDAVLEQPFFAPGPLSASRWRERVMQVRQAGDTVGGVVEVRAQGVPPGWGEPVFGKLDARLAGALMSVGAVKGVEIGAGFAAARLLGSENNDAMTRHGFASNRGGGVLGGISSGQDVLARVAVKPIPSIALEQRTVTTQGAETSIRIGGRHDISAIPRIVPVLGAMTALVLADLLLLDRRLGRER